MVEQPELKVTAIATDGKTYWLAEQTPEEREKSVCAGCAFYADSCNEDMPDDRCTGLYITPVVWKEFSQ